MLNNKVHRITELSTFTGNYGNCRTNRRYYYKSGRFYQHYGPKKELFKVTFNFCRMQVYPGDSPNWRVKTGTGECEEHTYTKNNNTHFSIVFPAPPSTTNIPFYTLCTSLLSSFLAAKCFKRLGKYNILSIANEAQQWRFSHYLVVFSAGYFIPSVNKTETFFDFFAVTP